MVKRKKWQETHCRTVKHAACNVDLWWKVEAFPLEILVDLTNVYQVRTTLCGGGPGLDEIENLLLDVFVQSSTSVGFEERGKIVHKLPRGNLGHEVGAAILGTRVGEVQGSKLNVWILVAYSALERAHGLFGLDRLGADDIGDFEVEGNVFETGRGCTVNLLVESRVACSKPPRHGLCLGQALRRELVRCVDGWREYICCGGVDAHLSVLCVLNWSGCFGWRGEVGCCVSSSSVASDFVVWEEWCWWLL